MAAQQTPPRRHGSGSGLERAFERKVRLSKWALQFERLWPRAWLLLGLAGLFVAVSLAGLWPRLPELPHKIVLALFGLAFVRRARVACPGALALPRGGHPPRRGRVRRPASPGVLLRGYADARRRGRPHGRALARASRASRRAAAEAAGRPPGAAHRSLDPFALRALLLLSVFVLTIIVGDSASDRLGSAFRFGPLAKGADARLDAWITPPAYTGKAARHAGRRRL